MPDGRPGSKRHAQAVSALPINPDLEDVAGMTEDQIWTLLDDETFDEDVLCEPMPPAPPLSELDRRLRRTSWPSSPTLVHEIAAARAGVATADSVGLAVRSVRRAQGLSQRGLADQLGESQTTIARLESAADRLALGRVVELLGRLGCTLVVGVDGRPTSSADWAASDLVARDSAGRRPPAHARVERVDAPHRYDARVDGGPVLWRWWRP